MKVGNLLRGSGFLIRLRYCGKDILAPDHHNNLGVGRWLRRAASSPQRIPNSVAKRHDWRFSVSMRAVDNAAVNISDLIFARAFVAVLVDAVVVASSVARPMQADGLDGTFDMSADARLAMRARYIKARIVGGHVLLSTIIPAEYLRHANLRSSAFATRGPIRRASFIACGVDAIVAAILLSHGGVNPLL